MGPNYCNNKEKTPAVHIVCMFYFFTSVVPLNLLIMYWKSVCERECSGLSHLPLA